VYDYDSGSITGQKSDWIGTFRIFFQFHLVEDRIRSSRWYGDEFIEDKCHWLNIAYIFTPKTNSTHTLIDGPLNLYAKEKIQCNFGPSKT